MDLTKREEGGAFEEKQELFLFAFVGDTWHLRDTLLERKRIPVAKCFKCARPLGKEHMSLLPPYTTFDGSLSRTDIIKLFPFPGKVNQDPFY